MDYIIDLKNVNLSHLPIVGGKNASLGEMIQHMSRQGINIPGGFATTADAFNEFLAQDGLDKKITRLIKSLNTNNVTDLNKASLQIRRWILATPFFPAFETAIASALANLSHRSVAVRSSATAEDLPTASFAGQQETYLNVKGLKNILRAIKLVFASLFTSRAIAYRGHHDFNNTPFTISAGIQPMIRSDKGASGVIFTIDTESGFDKVVLITASYGLGEGIVQGSVNPDEFFVYKPALAAGNSSILQRKLGDKAIKMIYTQSTEPHKSLKFVKVPEKDRMQFCINDQDIETLSCYAMMIEKHYGRPMDIEWAKDGLDNKIYILQARPETVASRKVNEKIIERYSLMKSSNPIVEGQSIGQQIGQGNARLIMNPSNMHMMKTGEVLVTDMTDPDWEPIMKRASAIVTNRGGRTCHAAIIARELGIPALVGCGNATTVIKNNMSVTVSCAEGRTGHVYAGKLPYKVDKITVQDMPPLSVDICMNIGNPDRAFVSQFLPNKGVGLARLEFIISNMIGIHPSAALNVKKLPKKLQQQIYKKTAAYATPVEYYIERLREGISMIAAAFDPKQVIFRLSDFKSNEYANLLGGHLYEPEEENPMIGFRGASRYLDKRFVDCFALECKAFKRVREEMGLTNAAIMIPFVRTVDELREVISLMSEYGLTRGENSLKIYMMCEIPSNVILAEEFLAHVDGFSIGSNDLTQLTLGLDRDSSLVAHLFDERNEAIKKLLHHVIKICNQQQKYIGICGQAPSDYPDFAAWLMKEGIQSMSLNPDTVVDTWMSLHATQDTATVKKSRNVTELQEE